jgi:MtN3 and saliva related transmembrane protein
MIGWVSSMLLVLTIGKQIYKQWQEESSEGVSKWLFIGQVAASVGFTVYSWMVKNWVFVVANLLMLFNAFIGLVIVFYHRRRSPKSAVRSDLGNARHEEGGSQSARGSLYPSMIVCPCVPTENSIWAHYTLLLTPTNR